VVNRFGRFDTVGCEPSMPLGSRRRRLAADEHEPRLDRLVQVLGEREPDPAGTTGDEIDTAILQQRHRFAAVKPQRHDLRTPQVAAANRDRVVWTVERVDHQIGERLDRRRFSAEGRHQPGRSRSGRTRAE
jgi:hypothetical protein